MKIRSRPFALFLLPFSVFGIASRAYPQNPDYSVLRINEVLSNNELAEPADHGGHHHDMVEIYNGGDQLLVLGKSPSSQSLALSDTVDQPPESQLWKFEGGGVSNIPSKGFILVFVASEPDGALACELFTDKFKLANDGSEPITLWGPANPEGKREVIDQVWLPPLDNDVSFGRYPDGAGPAKPTLDETLQNFKYYPAGTTTFGTCGTVCNAGIAICRGAPNGPGGNIAPKVNRLSHTTNHPGAGEPVTFTVSVEDDKDPLPANLKTVAIRYSVNDVAQPDVAMEYDGKGIQTGAADGKPLERWTVWTGTIPGQAEGAKVTFTFYVEDMEGLSRTDPKTLCAESVGPCDDLGLPGPNCVKRPPPDDKQYVSCSTPFRYSVGYTPPSDIAGLVINEVMAVQAKTIDDPTQPGHYDDYIEILNTGSSEVNLGGLWLADKPFEPLGWTFPEGSKIAAGEHLIVWCDSDGGKCPRPPKQSGDGQECPDPTNPGTQSYHTNFGLETDGDQIYLYDRLPGLGVIDGIEFGPQTTDKALARVPDGSREGPPVVEDGTPGKPNGSGSGPAFRRGDTNGDCQADITDAIVLLDFLFRGGAAPPCPDAADSDDNGNLQITDPIYLLQYLFQGGPAPPDPGETTPGPDPTPDALGDCQVASC